MRYERPALMSKSNGFSENANLYASSAPHAETGDLDLALPSLGDPEGRTLLDVATGTGPTAFFFATLGAHVFAVDINDEMLAVAQEESDRKSLSCRFIKGNAYDLPFDDGTFDIVTSRLAAHHFASPGDFLDQAYRVLRSDGRLLVIDNIVPEGPAGAWINDYEKQRDGSHEACLTELEWRDLLTKHGFKQVAVQQYPKRLDFTLWMGRMSIEGADTNALWEKLENAPEEVRSFLQPLTDKDGRYLTLHRLLAVAEKN